MVQGMNGYPRCTAIAGIALGACGPVAPPELAPGFESDLTSVEGCWDLLVGAQNATPDDGVTMQMNLLWTEGHVCWAQEADVRVEAEADLGDYFGPTMEVLLGFDLTRVCSDAELTDDLRARYVATEGTVTLTIDPVQKDWVAECDGYADVTVRDVRFENPSTGHAVELEAFEWRGLLVGWTAG